MSARAAQTISLRGSIHAVVAEATEQDAAALLSYLEVVAGETDFLTFGPGEVPLTIEQEEAFVRGLRESGGLMLKASIDGELAGVATLIRLRQPRVRHTAQLGISVLQKYWGMGMGRELMETLIVDARALGITRIELRVRHDNARARALYEALGFRFEGTLRGAFVVNGVEHDDSIMGLRLAHGATSTPPR